MSSYVGYNSTKVINTASGITLDSHKDTRVNDLIFVSIASSGNAYPVLPSGFTLISSGNQGQATLVNAYKFATYDGSESVTFNYTGSRYPQGIIATFRDISSVPIYASGRNLATNTSGVYACSSASSISGYFTIRTAAMQPLDSLASFTTISGHTSLFNSTNSGNIGFSSAFKESTTSSEGSGYFNWSTSGTVSYVGATTVLAYDTNTQKMRILRDVYTPTVTTEPGHSGGYYRSIERPVSSNQSMYLSFAQGDSYYFRINTTEKIPSGIRTSLSFQSYSGDYNYFYSELYINDIKIGGNYSTANSGILTTDYRLSDAQVSGIMSTRNNFGYSICRLYCSGFYGTVSGSGSGSGGASGSGGGPSGGS